LVEGMEMSRFDSDKILFIIVYFIKNLLLYQSI